MKRAAWRSGLAILGVAGAVWLGGLIPARPAGADGAKESSFLGANECKKCHFKQWKSWKDTKMAKAYEALKPGQAVEAKTKACLDPAKDYTQDEGCLACHTTGYGQPGGFPKLGTGDDAARKAREGVQCESCHGAASAYNPYMKEHEKAGYKKEEAEKLGLVTPNEKTCTSCHHGGPGGSPTIAADAKFDAAAKMKEEGAIHVHPPKK